MWILINLLLTLGKGLIVKEGTFDFLFAYLVVYGVLLTGKFKNKVLCYKVKITRTNNNFLKNIHNFEFRQPPSFGLKGIILGSHRYFVTIFESNFHHLSSKHVTLKMVKIWKSKSHSMFLTVNLSLKYWYTERGFGNDIATTLCFNRDNSMHPLLRL